MGILFLEGLSVSNLNSPIRGPLGMYPELAGSSWGIREYDPHII